MRLVLPHVRVVSRRHQRSIHTWQDIFAEHHVLVGAYGEISLLRGTIHSEVLPLQ
jgi:hypothetical protein